MTGAVRGRVAPAVERVAATPLPPAPLARRLLCLVYEAMLLFGIVFGTALVYGVATQQRHALEGRSGLLATLFLVLAAYFIGFWLHGGQTLAMKTWHIRLQSVDGRPVTPLRALCRYLAGWAWVLPPALVLWALGLTHQWAPYVVATAAWFVGYVAMTVRHPRHQFLHDAACGTELVSVAPPSRARRGDAAVKVSDTPAPRGGEAPFRVCVYCGSQAGHDPRFAEAAREVGRALGAAGHGLVYGGGRVGLMGAVADAALAAGAEVLGVIPERLMAREVGHAGLQELRVVPTMHARKHAMADAADAFLALPGGLGTLEELFEAWTWRQLGYHAKPLGLLDVGGYFEPLLRFLDRSVEAGFVSVADRALLHVDDDAGRLLATLAVAAGR